MSMEATAIRFERSEKEWIKAFADLNGKSFSSQVREWVLEKLEDEMDARDLKMAVESDDGDEGVSLDDVMATYGVS